MRSVNVAMPLDDATDRVPPNVPDEALTETETLPASTRRSLASSTRTTGCVASAAPAPAPTGCVTTDNLVAAPAMATGSALEVCCSLPPSKYVVDTACTT